MRPAGFEPATCGLGNRHSIQLSYDRKYIDFIGFYDIKDAVKFTRHNRSAQPPNAIFFAVVTNTPNMKESSIHDKQ